MLVSEAEEVKGLASCSCWAGRWRGWAIGQQQQKEQPNHRHLLLLEKATHLGLIKSCNTQPMDARVDSRAASVEENDSADINAPLKAAPKLVAPEPGTSDSPFATHSG